MTAGDEAKLAAFDFDGTLSRRDTMVPFLVQARGWPRLAAATVLAAPAALAGRRNDGQGSTNLRDGLKVASVGRLLRGMTGEQLAELGRTYAATLHDLLRPEMLEQLRWHQDEGHTTVVVSASLALYLRPLAAELGIDDVLAVELAVDARGVLTGRIEGGVNTRGPHKVSRLREWTVARFGPNVQPELWAYGDSDGDRELLAAADHPTWVGR